MSTLLDSLASTIDADAIAGIGKALGTDSAAVTKGLGAIAPLLLNSMSKMAGTPGGADSLLKMLPESTGLLGSLGSLFSSAFGGGTATGGILPTLLGPGFNAIVASLSRTLGFNVAPLVGAVAPALLGAIAKAVKSQGLDASGLASLLAKEQAAFTADPANQEALALAASAADAGNQATAMIA